MPRTPETGQVIRYSFLWPAEAAQGEESGRKGRPVCLVIPVTGNDTTVVLFPLTTRQPAPERLAVEVPETERRRLRLPGTERCWILLDVANRDNVPGSVHIEPIAHAPLRYTYGQFSHPFMAQILAVIASAIRARRLKAVRRG